MEERRWTGSPSPLSLFKVHYALGGLYFLNLEEDKNLAHDSQTLGCVRIPNWDF